MSDNKTGKDHLPVDKSLLPLSAKQAVKTTIVGGQPPGNDRPMQTIPVGIEQIMGMAAVHEEFKAILLNDRLRAIEQSGVELTPTEKGILQAIDPSTLGQMIDSVQGKIPEESRRGFLSQIGCRTAGVFWYGPGRSRL